MDIEKLTSDFMAIGAGKMTQEEFTAKWGQEMLSSPNLLQDFVANLDKRASPFAGYGKKQITRGELEFIPNAFMPFLFPRFFVGTALDSSLAAHLNDNRKNADFLKAGQFLFQHQYAGHSCRTVDVFGIILPIVTATGSNAVDQLAELAVRYGENSSPVPAQLNAELSVIGPMRVPTGPSPSNLNEAFFQFSNPDDIYPWLSTTGFQHVLSFDERSESEIRDSKTRVRSVIPKVTDAVVQEHLRERFYREPVFTQDHRDQMLRDGSGRMVVEEHLIQDFFRQHIRREPELYAHTFQTKALGWESIAVFSEWLQPPGWKLNPADVFVAFMYENSD